MTVYLHFDSWQERNAAGGQADSLAAAAAAAAGNIYIHAPSQLLNTNQGTAVKLFLQM